MNIWEYFGFWAKRFKKETNNVYSRFSQKQSGHFHLKTMFQVIYIILLWGKITDLKPTVHFIQKRYFETLKRNWKF